ncbi:MAG: hypothetical protein HY536_01745 [Candidatus Colwellbacteria bacterium]|nr:hypothetical protein [Candidatus Colwellbacteria bacterium]
MESFTKRFYLVEVGIPAVVLVALLALAFLLRFDIARRASAIEELRSALAARAQAVETLAALRESAERARIYASVLGNILPTRDQLIGFPKEFELIAKKFDVRLSAAFGGETAATVSEPGSIEFSFSVRGSYADIVAFLAAAEQSRYIIAWSGFEFLKEKGELYTATASGRVFTR